MGVEREIETSSDILDVHDQSFSQLLTSLYNDSSVRKLPKEGTIA